MTRYTPQWLQSGSYAASQDRRLINALWPGPASSGCAVTASAGMVVNVAPGQVAVPTQNNTGATLCTSDAVEAVTLTAAPASGLNRIDLIICRPRGNDLDGGANNDFIFDFVTGTAAATPAIPATPAGTVALAQIAVAGGSASIVAGNLTDVRPGGLALSSLAVPASVGRGYVASITGPATAVACPTGGTVFLTLTASVVAGRIYLVTGSILGTSSAAGVGPRVDLGGVDIVSRPLMVGGASVLANGISGAGFANKYTAATTGPHSFTLTGFAGVGTFTLGASQSELVLTDIGGS